MRKPFLALLIIYFSTFLFFQEEIHTFSHHLKEVNHIHSLKCFFDGGEEKKPGLAETCFWHKLFLGRDFFVEMNFSSLIAPKLLNVTYFFPERVPISENFIFFLPPSRAPPVIS